MAKNLYNFSAFCPLVEEFNIKNVEGCFYKKFWVFGDTVLDHTTTTDFTLATLSAGFVTTLNNYQVVVQKIDATPVNRTFVSAKTATGFTLNGDDHADGGSYNILVLGSEMTIGTDTGHKAGSKWAQDYCPACKAMGIKGLVGSSRKDMAFFGFEHTQVGGGSGVVGTDVIKFRDYNHTTGAQKHVPLSQMYDTTYLAFLTGAPLNSAADNAYISSVVSDGFSIVGEGDSVYKILIFGQVQY